MDQHQHASPDWRGHPACFSGAARVLPILGWPVEQVKAPGLFNTYFVKHRIDAVVVPMAVTPEDCAATLRQMLKAGNCDAALITIPHKSTVAGCVDALSERARIANACNAVVRRPDGSLYGDLLDGEGFVGGLARAAGESGFDYARSSALIVGTGGVGKAIASALAERGIRRLGLYDTDPAAAQELRQRLVVAFPALTIDLAGPRVAGHDLLINCTPLGMSEDDPLPLPVDRLVSSMIVADCVMKVEMTPLLRAAQAAGCRIQRGREMLLEQAPLYMALFGWGGTTSGQFRAL